MNSSSPEVLALTRWAAGAEWPKLEINLEGRSIGDYKEVIGPGRLPWLRFLTNRHLGEITAALEAAGLPTLPLCIQPSPITHYELHPLLSRTISVETGFGRAIFQDEAGFGWIPYFDGLDREPCDCCLSPLMGGWFGVDELEDNEVPNPPFPISPQRIDEVHNRCIDCVDFEP